MVETTIIDVIEKPSPGVFVIQDRRSVIIPAQDIHWGHGRRGHGSSGSDFARNSANAAFPAREASDIVAKKSDC